MNKFETWFKNALKDQADGLFGAMLRPLLQDAYKHGLKDAQEDSKILTEDEAIRYYEKILSVMSEDRGERVDVYIDFMKKDLNRLREKIKDASQLAKDANEPL